MSDAHPGGGYGLNCVSTRMTSTCWANALTTLATDLLVEGRETLTQISGGGSASHSLTLICDPAMTGDLYRDELARWAVDRKDPSKDADGDG